MRAAHLRSHQTHLDGTACAEALDLGEQVALETFLASDPVEADQRGPADQAQRRIVNRRSGRQQSVRRHC